VRLYYLGHGFETADTFLTHHLTVLAFASLGKLKAASPTATASAPEGAEHVADIPGGLSVDDIGSTPPLAAEGLNDQRRSYYLSYALFHVIRAQMDQRDIDVLYQFINTRLEASDVGQLRIRHVRARYPVDIVRMIDNFESKRLENIINEFAGWEISMGMIPSGEATGSEAGMRTKLLTCVPSDPRNLIEHSMELMVLGGLLRSNVSREGQDVSVFRLDEHCCEVWRLRCHRSRPESVPDPYHRPYERSFLVCLSREHLCPVGMGSWCNDQCFVARFPAIWFGHPEHREVSQARVVHDV